MKFLPPTSVKLVNFVKLDGIANNIPLGSLSQTNFNEWLQVICKSLRYRYQVKRMEFEKSAAGFGSTEEEKPFTCTRKTGRFSSSSPNVQQAPSRGEFTQEVNKLFPKRVKEAKRSKEEKKCICRHNHVLGDFPTFEELVTKKINPDCKIHGSGLKEKLLFADRKPAIFKKAKPLPHVSPDTLLSCICQAVDDSEKSGSLQDFKIVNLSAGTVKTAIDYYNTTVSRYLTK